MMPKGTIITCPKCGRLMARSLQDIIRGSILMAAMFENIEGSIGPQRPMICPFDGERYFTVSSGRTVIHTKDGWI